LSLDARRDRARIGRKSRTLRTQPPSRVLSGSRRPHRGGSRMVSCSTGGCRTAQGAVSRPRASASHSAA